MKGVSHKQVHSVYKYEVPNSSQSEQGGGKCYPLIMGGTSLEDGLTTSSLQPKCCDKLRCYDCHKKVVKYRNQKWKSNVDYLFVRNHVTNLKELEKVKFQN